MQLKHTVAPELLYRHYWYRSGINESMRIALADITAQAEKRIELSQGDIVLDIGCNDGTMLRSYKTPGLRLVGFEPATNLIQEAQVGTTKIINDFFNFEAFEECFGDTKAKIITSIAMFYDLDDPNTFVEDIVKCLAADGMWIIQMNYLPTMLEQNSFDNICHEHLEYYSLMALENLLVRHNLEVFDVELNDVNGGSFRTYIKHKESKQFAVSDKVRELREYERNLGLHNQKVYHAFATRVNRIKEKLRNFIEQETNRGKKIYAYGAGTKGNTILQFFELDHRLIKKAAEVNPEKWGKKTVGTQILIISEEQARAEKPDYFLILPWFFLEGFKRREKAFLESGGKFIVPLPDFRIIGAGE